MNSPVPTAQSFLFTLSSLENNSSAIVHISELWVMRFYERTVTSIRSIFPEYHVFSAVSPSSRALFYLCYSLVQAL